MKLIVLICWLIALPVVLFGEFGGALIKFWEDWDNGEDD